MNEAYTNAAGKPVCGYPCHYGGSSAARKYSSSDLGYWGKCNNVVGAQGAKCWRHLDELGGGAA